MGKINIEELIESYASFLMLPPQEQTTIDKIMELLGIVVTHSEESKENLKAIASKKPYKGNKPAMLLLLYDVLGGKSNRALTYGIQGLESLGRDAKQIVNLEHPERLAEYLASTAEGLEELVTLKDILLTEGKFRYHHPGLKGYVDAKKTLIQPLLTVANELAYRLKDVDPRRRSAPASDKEIVDQYAKWRVRLDSHAAIVIAYQANGKYPVNREALDALAAYEALAETYQADWFSIDLMREYFKIKYVAGKPSTGKVPEDLKSDPQKRTNAFFWGRIDWDQEFKRDMFGDKEPEWKKYEWQRAQQEKARQEKEKRQRLEDWVDDLLKDPWEANAKYLKIMGLNKEMTYDEARAAFRRTIMQHRTTFSMSAQEKGTQTYELAMKAAGEVLEAWKKVEPLYKEKQPPETAKQEETIQAQPKPLN